jgi:hypothetical protein
MFTESLPSNKRLFFLHYSGFRASCHNNEVLKNAESDIKSANGTISKLFHNRFPESYQASNFMSVFIYILLAVPGHALLWLTRLNAPDNAK